MYIIRNIENDVLLSWICQNEVMRLISQLKQCWVLFLKKFLILSQFMVCRKHRLLLKKIFLRMIQLRPQPSSIDHIVTSNQPQMTSKCHCIIPNVWFWHRALYFHAIRTDSFELLIIWYSSSISSSDEVK